MSGPKPVASTTFDIHDRAVALTVMFMDATGHRACSLVKSDKHEHTVLSSQVTVTYTDQDGQERVVQGGSEETKDIIPGQSTEISITVLTSKPNGLCPTQYTFDLGDARTRRLVRCGSEYMKLSGAGPDDPFLTYVRQSVRKRGPQSWSKRSGRAADINREIKRSAVANGFPPQHCSTRSYRLQLATKNQLAGVPVAETCRIGGWMSSRTMTGTYDQSETIAHNTQHAATVPAGATSSNNARLSADQVALMLSAESRTARRNNLAHMEDTTRDR